MFDLVADIERYPEFVPLCRSMRVRRRISEEGREIVIAEMTVAYKLLRETFASRVTLDRDHLSILVNYLDGPFSRMENRWQFHPVPMGDEGRVGVGESGAGKLATLNFSSPMSSGAARSRC